MRVPTLHRRAAVKMHGSKMHVGTTPISLSSSDRVRKKPTGPARILVSPESLFAASQQIARKAVAAKSGAAESQPKVLSGGG